jgi:TatD DNase family protein
VAEAVVEWFDSHCHLQEEFAAEVGSAPETGARGNHEAGPHASALAGAIARAAEAGVTRMVCVGTGEATSAQAISLVREMRHPDSVAVAEGVRLWATIGLHPHDAIEGVDSLDGLLAAELGGDGSSLNRVVVAIGECGLDYHYDHSPRPVQREAFARQIELANRHRLTLVVHTREAWDDTLDILRAAGVPERTIVHCFTGGPDEARRCLDLGASLSFSGVVTFKNASEVRAAAALCPTDRLLVETDSPFLAPVPHRGTFNEPSRTPLVGATVAQVKGLPTATLAAGSTANALAMFSL